MTLEELLALHTQTCDAAKETMIKKNHDYTGGSDPFANFKASRVVGIDPVLGILMRVMDKFKRIETFVNNGELLVEGEGVLDAVDDTINYMILAKGLLIERGTENVKND